MFQWDKNIKSERPGLKIGIESQTKIITKDSQHIQPEYWETRVSKRHDYVPKLFIGSLTKNI